MKGWLVSGLAALVLGNGCAGVHEQVQSNIEITVITYETPKKDMYKETKDLCYVADALYKVSSNDFTKWYGEAIKNIEDHKLSIKDNPDFALAYNRMAEYYLASKEYDKAEKYADIAFDNFPHPLFKATVEMIKIEREKQREREKQKAIPANFT